MINKLITGILAVKVLTNYGFIDAIQRKMTNFNQMFCLSSALAVLNRPIVYRYQMNINGKQDLRGLSSSGLRGGVILSAQ